jgi:hypothetical protein
MFGGIKKELCLKCNLQIAKNNFSRHVGSCIGPKQKKIRGLDFDPNIGYQDGSRSAWNKGKTKQTDPIVAQQADTRRENYKSGKISASGAALWTTEKRSEVAKSQGFGGYRPNAGRSKKYKITDSYGNIVTLQSSYELICSEILNDLNILWSRPKALMYDSRRYYPDFYLPEYDIYLDPKNDFKAKQDKEKIQKVVEQNNVTVYVVLKEQLNKQWFCNLVGKIGD